MFNEFFIKWKSWLDSFASKKISIDGQKCPINDVLTVKDGQYFILGKKPEYFIVEIEQYQKKSPFRRWVQEWTTDILGKIDAVQYYKHHKKYQEKTREFLNLLITPAHGQDILSDVSLEIEAGIERAVNFITGSHVLVEDMNFLQKYWPSQYRRNLINKPIEKAIFSQNFSEETSSLIDCCIDEEEKHVSYDLTKVRSSMFNQYIRANVNREHLSQWSESIAKIKASKQINEDLLSQLQELNIDLGDTTPVINQTKNQIGQLKRDLNQFRAIPDHMISSNQKLCEDIDRTIISIFHIPETVEEKYLEAKWKIASWSISNDSVEDEIKRVSLQNNYVKHLEVRQLQLKQKVEVLHHQVKPQPPNIIDQPQSRLLQKDTISTEFSFMKTVADLGEYLKHLFFKPSPVTPIKVAKEEQILNAVRVTAPGLTHSREE